MGKAAPLASHKGSRSELETISVQEEREQIKAAAAVGRME